MIIWILFIESINENFNIVNIKGYYKKFSKIIKKYGTFFNISLLIIKEDKEIIIL